MGIKNTSGFTIIEVMLFLAVSGALTVALLAGSGVAIGQQRYRDSVNTLESLIQEQYSDVVDVSNDRGPTSGCDSNATVTVPPQTVTDPQSRGTSGCVLLGRLLTVDATGTKITTQNVVGQQKSQPTVETTDVADLQNNYNFGLSPLNQETTDVAWGAKVVKPASVDTPQPLSLLILRSPLSGGVYTFVEPDKVVQTKADILGAVQGFLLNKQNEDVCVNGGITTSASQLLAIRIDANAASQSAVEIPLQSENVCH